MVRKRKVVDPMVNFGVGVARPFCSELPYGPILPMLGVQELDQSIGRIAVRSLWIR